MSRIGSLLSFTILLSLAACSKNENADLDDYLAGIDSKIAHKAPIKINLPPLNKPVTYQAKTLRAPFHSNAQQESEKMARAQGKPLLMYPLDALQFVGIMSEGPKNFALIATPDSTIYQAQVGDFIGDNNGRISTIGTDSIQVETNGIATNDPKQIITLQLKGKQ